MGSGRLEAKRLDWLIEAVLPVSGDFCEFGVYQGTTFRRLLEHAKRAGRKAYAFDSFLGMDEPGEHDGTGYPKGRFTVGGWEKFQAEMGGPDPAMVLRVGYIPALLFDARQPGPERIAFAYLDLDHYAPTLAALEYVWRRLSPGGLVLCDDYEPDKTMLASRAIVEFAASEGLAYLPLLDDQCLFVKDGAGSMIYSTLSNHIP